MPQIRPFRALRFDPSAVGDVADVLAPMPAIIDAAEHERLLARHPANVVRVDLPEERFDDQPDDRFRRAARALAEWRSGAVLHKDPHPSVYVYERLEPATTDRPERRQLGYFARLHLEALGADSGIEATEDEAAAASTDERYRLVRATGINSRPVIGTYTDPAGETHARLAAVATRAADEEACDDAGVRHRLWAVPADGPGGPAVEALMAPAVAGPLSLVVGRATYESAVRYRDERRMSRSCEEDPAFDYVLALLIERSDASDAPAAAIGLVLNPHEW